MHCHSETKYFTFHKERKTLVAELSELRLNRFPKTISIKSSDTGATVMFHADTQLAIENEFWDGHQMVYKPVPTLQNVKQVVLINN